MLLAIDTATPTLSLALHNGRALLAEQTWTGAEDPTAELAPAVCALLERCGATFQQLAALAVCAGPGMYAELRAGVAFAKGLAAGRGLPLVGVSALDILAVGQPHFQGVLIAAAQTGRGRIAVGRYQWRKGRWGGRGAPQLMDWETLFNSIDGPAFLTGDLDDAGQDALAAAIAQEVPISLIPPAYRLRRAGFLAEEAWTRLRGDKADFPAAALRPITLKAAEPSTS